MASVLTGEKTKDVITHCLHSFSILGVPKQIKTDNGPGYTPQAFKQFCSTFGIQHVTGIPYNPTGQSIVDCAHLTLKNMLYKQKGGIGASYRSPKDKLSVALFILNFLNLDSEGRSAADHHSEPNKKHLPQVLWKDILSGQWKGPDPVLIWTRGSVCVFPQDAQSPIWVPERLVKASTEIQKQEEDEEASPADGAGDFSPS